jgi:hypothetical protein
MKTHNKTKTFWDYYDEVPTEIYSNQLEIDKPQTIIFKPGDIKVVSDKQKNTDQNAEFMCNVVALNLKDDFVTYQRVKIILPRRTFIKMFRKSEHNLKLYVNETIEIRFKVKSKFRYELISLVKSSLEQIGFD